MKKNIKIACIAVLLCTITSLISAQVLLNADGVTDTYALINSKFAPGGGSRNAVEVPDAVHPGFGKHITQVYDITLDKQVFEFNIHVTNSPIDNDISTGSSDRQRIEIKTYDQSPDSLKGFIGNVVTYKWQFKVPVGFQPTSNFTHLHQVKPVNGDDSTPLFTLTARKGTPNKMELTYYESTAIGQTKPQIVLLSAFEGQWVEVTENITVGAAGKYSIVVRKVSDGTILMNYSNNNILTLRSDNSFIRPKWGIYRNVVNIADLRDESMRFSDFSVGKGSGALAGNIYYWVGGTGIQSFTDNSKWNTQLDGFGTTRPSSASDDVLIFDGSNFGGTVPTTGTVIDTFRTADCGQLILHNAADVTFQRTSAPGAATGTAALTINGDGTSDDDFIISANSTLTVRATTIGYGMNVIVGSLGVNLATAAIYGTVNFTDGGLTGSGTTTSTRFTASNPGSIKFEAGSLLNSTLTYGSNTPFAPSPAQATRGTEFMAGSKAVLLSGNLNSINGTSSTANPIKWNAGSLLEIYATALPSGMFNSKTLANVTLRNGVSYTLAENFFNIDTLTVDAGATFNFRITGGSPFSGNIINNGTFGAATPFTSGNLLFVGAVPQSIGGSGTFNNLANITIGTGADVTVNRNIAISGSSTSNVLGMLNMGTNTLSGTAGIQTRSAATATTTNNAAVVAGSNTVTMSSPAVYSAGNIATGVLVTGVEIPANTYIIATNSGASSFTISKPALTTNATASIIVSNTAPTLKTANTGGVDATIANSGTRNLGTGTNLVMNGATTSPFPSFTNNNLGDLTINAAVTTNKLTQSLNGSLILTSGILSIRAGDTIRIRSGNAVGGSPFSASKYVALQSTSSNSGVLRMDDISSASLFPIGSSTNYLPATVVPTSLMDYAVTVFEGTTVDGTQGGTPLTAGQKADLVDATWIIDRKSGSGAADVTLNWAQSLEGSVFTTLPDAQVGMSRYDGSMYEAAMGSGNNTTNTVTATYSSFSPFIVGRQAGVVPVKLTSIAAINNKTSVDVIWTVETELNVVEYVVEKSTDGQNFKAIGKVSASQKKQYSYTDLGVVAEKAYYRIRVVENGTSDKYSATVLVKNAAETSVTLYPNPAVNTLFLAGLPNDAVVRIISTTGQVMQQVRLTANTASIDVSRLASAVYIVEIKSNTSSELHSFKKQ